MKFIIELYDEIRYEGLIEYILDKEMNYLSTKKNSIFNAKFFVSSRVTFLFNTLYLSWPAYII